MALITERYAAEIQGVLTCYDRMIIQGYVPLTQKVRGIAEAIAKESGIEIEFIRKQKVFRKDERTQEIMKSN